jgi:hypothetical protein
MYVRQYNVPQVLVSYKCLLRWNYAMRIVDIFLYIFCCWLSQPEKSDNKIHFYEFHVCSFLYFINKKFFFEKQHVVLSFCLHKKRTLQCIKNAVFIYTWSINCSIGKENAFCRLLSLLITNFSFSIWLYSDRKKPLWYFPS